MVFPPNMQEEVDILSCESVGVLNTKINFDLIFEKATPKTIILPAFDRLIFIINLFLFVQPSVRPCCGSFSSILTGETSMSGEGGPLSGHKWKESALTLIVRKLRKRDNKKGHQIYIFHFLFVLFSFNFK